MSTAMPKRVRLLAGIGAGVVLVGLAATACDSTPAKVSAPATTTSTATSTSTTTTTTTAPAPTTSTATSAQASQPAPTLGQPWNTSQKGYGTVRPAVIDNGGDGTGVVDGVKWQSWGAATAVATGTAFYVAPDAPDLAHGVSRTATVQAFNLGMCHGKLMYQAVEWYFLSEGGKFDPNDYWNICTGERVGSN